MISSSTIPVDYQLVTRRLRLRIADDTDIPFVFSASRFEGFNDGMAWEQPKSIEELGSNTEKYLKAWREGRSYGFTIEDRVSRDRFGRISIRATERNRVWDIGFWTHPDHQGKGIMTEACTRVIKFGHEDLSAIAIEASHALWNSGSEKVLKNSGMKFVQYNERGLFKKGDWVEESLMRIELGNR